VEFDPGEARGFDRSLREVATTGTGSLAVSVVAVGLTKLVLLVVLLPVLLRLFRRWHDWTLLAVGLLLEVSTFVTVSIVVGRARPPVEQLDGAPTNSFPSGHIAASVVFYVGLAVIVFWHTRSSAARGFAVLLAVVAPAAVILSRLYLGMHYPTDAAAGVLVGLVSLAFARAALQRTMPQPVRTQTPAPAPNLVSV